MYYRIYIHLQAVVLISSPVIMASVYQNLMCVMVMMTVEMTVMKKDVGIHIYTCTCTHNV